MRLVVITFINNCFISLSRKRKKRAWKKTKTMLQKMLMEKKWKRVRKLNHKKKKMMKVEKKMEIKRKRKEREKGSLRKKRNRKLKGEEDLRNQKNVCSFHFKKFDFLCCIGMKAIEKVREMKRENLRKKIN